MNLLNGQSLVYGSTLGNMVQLVDAPSDQNDMSVLPNGAAPADNTAYEAFAPGIHWTIRSGETVWSQSVRATSEDE